MPVQLEAEYTVASSGRGLQMVDIGGAFRNSETVDPVLLIVRMYIEELIRRSGDAGRGQCLRQQGAAGSWRGGDDIEWRGDTHGGTTQVSRRKRDGGGIVDQG